MMSFDFVALKRWQALVADCLERLAQEGQAKTGVPTVNNPEASIGWRATNPDRPPKDAPGWYSMGSDPALLGDHLEAQAALNSEAIECAVISWSETGDQPEWGDEEGMYFSFRLALAKQVVQDLHLRQEKSAAIRLAGPFPDPNDHAQFMKWIFITVWDAMGNLYLQHFADDVRKRHPLYRGQNQD
jgi:hypothetical protein